MNTAKRYSKQRFTILHELKQLTSHPTADEMYEIVKKTIPNISLGTVYRNLNSLYADGEILKFVYNGRDHFDANITPHIHLCCQNCGCICDVLEHFDSFENALKSTEFYNINNIIINGVCQNCR